MQTNQSVARHVLLAALLCAACSYATNIAARPIEADEAAAVAHAALARLPAESRVAEIKNERLRHAVQTAYRAVVELADNRDANKVASLNAKFERAFTDVERETAGRQYKTCTANCKALDGAQCLTKCKAAGKKFCGCKLMVFGCLVAECIV